MKNPENMTGPEHSGAKLILTGLFLALLGAGAIMLMVLGVSYLYVARYGLAVINLGGLIFCGCIFLKTYGPYLDRLERWAPTKSSADLSGPDTQVSESTLIPPEQNQEKTKEPQPTSVIVSIATSAYGLLVMLCGLIWTQGNDLILNLLAGGALLAIAAIVWRLGRSVSQSKFEPGGSEKRKY